MNANLFARLESTIVDPRRISIEYPQGKKLTYGDLLTLSGRLANVLVERGVEPGDRVAVQVEKSVAGLALFLATVRAGAVFLPLNTAYTLNELAYFLGDAEPALVVCDPGRAGEIEPVAAKFGAKVETLDSEERGSLMDAAADAPADFETVLRAGDDIAAILYTSGTTGRSKGAMITHDNLYTNARTLIETWRFGPDDVLIHVLPIYHTHGLFVAANVVLFSGGAMIFLPKFNAEQVIGLMGRATSMMGVPTYYVRLLQCPELDRAAVSKMRLFTSGSAPLLAETHRAWTARTGHEIVERYGMTETNMNTSNPYDGSRVPGSVGLPLKDVEVRIVDRQTGKIVPEGEVGMIELKGPNVFKGYWRMPEKTAEEFRADGFFVTGDLGRKDSRGYVYIIGRDKDLIISGGLNVYPKEVEDRIDALDGVVESAVIGIPHPDLGEGVIAVVVPSRPLAEAAIIAALKDQLAAFKRPKHVVFERDLPRNTMGKVQKNLLRDRYGDLFGA